MSDVNKEMLAGSEPRLFLAPHEVGVSEKFNVRRYSSEAVSAKEDQEIEELSRSLEEDGQLDDALVFEEKAGKYVVFAGHRRRMAMIRANERRTKVGQSLLRLRCRVVDKSDDLLKKAVVSNIQRKSIDPMSLALLFKSRMEERGLSGFKGQRMVAADFGVSAATVTEHWRFLDAPEELQEQLALGLISADSAKLILAGALGEVGKDKGKLTPEQKATTVKEVLEGARVEQVQAAAKKAVAEVAQGKKDSSQAQKDIEKAATGKIEAPAVRKAVRNLPDDKKGSDGPTPLTRKEIIEGIAEIDAPAYGYFDSAVRVWARAFIKWASGEMKDGAFFSRFDKMVEKADQGTKEADDKEEQRVKREEEKEARAKEKEKEEKAKAKAEEKAKNKPAKPAKPTKESKPKKSGKPTKPESSAE
jgi:ParB/RepB/Spo0J family partition protein